nr:hypothetical protein [Tanacetum cinerariifolium]
MLHPELPGPGDRIVDFLKGKVDERVFPTVMDWRTNASKDEMPMNGTYSVEAVRELDTHRTPIQKQPEMLLCLVRISRRYYLGDEVNGPIQLDSCLKSYQGEDLKPPSCPHEVPLLTLTASRVIEMDEPAIATDSSGVPSAIEKSPLDFTHEDRASNQGTAAPEMPLLEDVPATAAPGSLRRDHADLQPSGSSHGGKSLATMQLCLASNAFVSEGAPANVSDPDPLSFTDVPSHHPVNVAQSSQGIAAVGDPESENVSSPAEVGSPGSVYRPKWGVTNGSLLDTPKACQDLVDHAAPPGYFSKLHHMHNEKFLRQYNVNLALQVAMGSQLRLMFEQEVSHGQLSQQVASLKEQVSGEEKLKAAFEDFKRYEDERVERRCAELDARLDALSIDFDKELYPHMLTAIAGRRQAFADVVSARIAKGMSEGLKHGVEHGQAQLTVESIEAYDPEAEAKFVAALQSLKDLKYPLLDQLEGLKDAPMYVIMAALYLESDTWGMPHNIYAISAPTPLSLPSPCTQRSDGVSVFAPTVVPQGLALLLVDAATQVDLEDA